MPTTEEYPDFGRLIANSNGGILELSVRIKAVAFLALARIGLAPCF
jgi:hypothetical protein